MKGIEKVAEELSTVVTKLWPYLEPDERLMVLGTHKPDELITTLKTLTDKAEART